MATSTVSADELVNLRVGAEMVNTSYVTLRRRVRDGSLPAFRRDIDRRALYVRLADIRALAEPTGA